jgi:hypothetical protein
MIDLKNMIFYCILINISLKEKKTYSVYFNESSILLPRAIFFHFYLCNDCDIYRNYDNIHTYYLWCNE